MCMASSQRISCFSITFAFNFDVNYSHIRFLQPAFNCVNHPMTALPVLNMFKQNQSYEPIDADESHAELADWREDPGPSVESRNKQISIHRRPGFYKNGLLGSIALNAILLMACGLMYLKLIG